MFSFHFSFQFIEKIFYQQLDRLWSRRCVEELRDIDELRRVIEQK